MPYTHTVRDRIVHIAWKGDVNRDDMRSIGQLLPQLAESLGFAPDVLHTFTEMTGPAFEAWTAFEHSLRQEKVRLRNAAKSAVVAKTLKVHVVARMMQALNRNPNLTMEIFTSDEDALAWLHDE